MLVCFLPLKVFVKLWTNVLKIMNVLLLANNARSNKLEEQIFWYKATGHRDFKLGSKEFWEMSKGLDSSDEEETYDPKSQRKGPSIHVKKSKW